MSGKLLNLIRWPFHRDLDRARAFFEDDVPDLFGFLRRLRQGVLGREELLALRVALFPIAGGATELTDLKNNLVLANDGNTLVPATRTATANGAAVDLVDSDWMCFSLLVVGAVSGTTPTLDSKVQESATSGGTYTDITGATHAQVTASNKTSVINYKRTLRFNRGVATIGGTTPSFASAQLVFGQKKST